MIDVQDHPDRIERIRVERETSAEIGEAPAHPWLRYEVRPVSLFTAECICGLPLSGGTSTLACSCGRFIAVEWPCVTKISPQGVVHEA
jgi:hypothetical protein